MRSGRGDLTRAAARYIKFGVLLAAVAGVAALSLQPEHHHDHD